MECSLLENHMDLKLKVKISYLKSLHDDSVSRKKLKDVESYYNFCRNFFTVWNKFLARISPLIAEFNSSKSSVRFKQIFAELISDQYYKYFEECNNLKPPVFLKDSFNLFLDSIKNKRKFFDLFIQNYEDKNLDALSSRSAALEEQFWLELYRKNTELEGTENCN